MRKRQEMGVRKGKGEGSKESTLHSLTHSLLQQYHHRGGVPGGSSGGSVARVESASAPRHPHSPGWSVAGRDAGLVGPLRHHLL